MIKTTNPASTCKIVAASILGNTLEFYDFALFGMLSPILAPLFFPSADPMTSLILTLATYGVGFFMRPFGAIIFGHVGDKYGRKKALTLSILLMSLPTLCIAFLPTYQDIGASASILLVLMRLLQGFCTGGEYNGAALYVVENVPVNRRAFFGSLVSIAGAVGSVLAAVVSSALTAGSMPSYAWRFAFLMGSIVGLVGLYMRRQLPELVPEIQKPRTRTPLMQALLAHPRAALCTFGFASFVGSVGSLAFAYMSTFLTAHMGWSLSPSLLLMSIGTTTYIIAMPLIAHVADRFGHRRVCLIGGMATILFIIPIFSLIISEPTLENVLIAQVGLGLIAAGFQAPMNAFLASLFPAEVRYSGVAFSYSMGLAIFGGSTGMVVTALIKWTGILLVPALLITFLAIFGMLSVWLARPIDENKQEKITD